MTKTVWEMTHAVETSASHDFAWRFWTNVANWDDPPARFELDGPFARGARGTTHIPRQEPLQWFVREVTVLKAATIEMQLEGATISFEWRLEEMAAERTRLTQRVVLAGEKADVYVPQVKATFAANLPDGMNKLAKAMADAYLRRTDASREAS